MMEFSVGVSLEGETLSPEEIASLLEASGGLVPLKGKWVEIDPEKCIADKGCTVCVDVCPLDVLRISDMTNKAYMAYDECWYCMPCEADCPTGAVTVNIPYLLR